ncbi:efflux RND transporter periplasmic adaptor subunit [Ekhidna sp. MALMAid0563]|uniref:efflux RND transporter periplasmic adaptor subunit n=1 Tax=Ekhidna sp. MALMAid0563 TaxID=3143937 RepID=UPI0032DE88D9
MKRILYLVIILVVIGLIAYPKLPKGTSTEASDTPSNTQSEKLTVNAIIVNSEQLANTVNVTGSLIADESVVLNSELSGKIEKISFKEGQRVTKGQTIVTLNDDEILAEIEKLQFTKKLNEDDEYRQKVLLEKEAISREEYETALTTLNTVKSEIKVLEARLQKHYIKAPFSGITGFRDIAEGSYLNPGARITELYRINPIKLEFNIPSKYISLVNNGDQLTFEVDGYDEQFAGEIYAIEPLIDPQTRSISLRARASNDDSKLFPGQFARVSLTLETIPNALMIPTESVIPELSGKKVFLYKNGQVTPVQVSTGIRTEDRIQVTSGINEGDTVITTGILQIGPGMPVNVTIN